MPTYEYLCQACEHQFEEFQSITASALRKCPQCGKLKLRRLIGTGAGVIFKGSGFYETDYRSNSYKEAAKKEKSDASSTSSSSSKSESKGEAKGESKPKAKPESGGSKPAGGKKSTEAA